MIDKVELERCWIILVKIINEMINKVSKVRQMEDDASQNY